jgi:DNA repair protein RecN (Recombination protein N)
MLRHLSVENYALIDRLDMELGSGLNIVTGETGAGKSILLGALGLLTGTRSEAGVQRDPSRNCVVEGVFALDGYGLELFFAENDLEYDATTTIRRIVSSSGKSRAYINDLPVTLATLRELGERLIDIHSQHENLLLRSENFRTAILDGVAGQGATVKRYGELYAAWKSALRSLDDARRKADNARCDEDYIRHQVEGLASARLSEGEQEALETEERELTHSDEIREAMGLCAEMLGAEETGVEARLKVLSQAINKISGIHPRAAEFSARLSSAYLELQDLEREATAECERVEGNPERLAFVTERLGTIYSLQQKHRVGSVAELLELQRGFTEKLHTIEHGDEEVLRLESEAGAREAKVRELAAQITDNRRKAAPEVERSVVGMLQRLSIPEARLVAEIAPAPELHPNGGDEVRFLFTANGSMSPRPVEKIASGGEVSRVMLALKTLSARSAGQPTIVFDEIDAGVSGKVADAMGDIIAELGRGSQVINITHLPQIAAKQGEHFFVYKEGGATHIRRLAADERVDERAKMLSGSTITAAAVHQARELLKN